MAGATLAASLGLILGQHKSHGPVILRLGVERLVCAGRLDLSIQQEDDPLLDHDGFVAWLWHVQGQLQAVRFRPHDPKASFATAGISRLLEVLDKVLGRGIRDLHWKVLAEPKNPSHILWADHPTLYKDRELSKVFGT
jgi:hypothetical protein